MRLLSLTASRGLQPPSLEGKRLSLEIVKTLLTDHQGYASKMTEGVVDGMPKRPVDVCELTDEDQRRVLSDAYNEGRDMNEEQFLRALKRVAEVIDTIRDTQTLERESKENLKMDAKVPVMERVIQNIQTF